MMSSSFNLGVQLSTAQKLTPQLQQAIKLLQLSSLELEQEVQMKLDSNPLLERVEEDEVGAEDFNSLEELTRLELDAKLKRKYMSCLTIIQKVMRMMIMKQSHETADYENDSYDTAGDSQHDARGSLRSEINKDQSNVMEIEVSSSLKANENKNSEPESFAEGQTLGSCLLIPTGRISLLMEAPH